MFEDIRRLFVVVGNKAVTSPFNLNDMPGSAGRMDIMCRCIAQSLFVSHGIRKDSAVCLIFKGKPNPPKAILVKGSEVKYMAPDERNIGGILRKALELRVNEGWTKSTPGVYVSKKGIKDVLDELEGFEIFYLREDGEDVRNVRFGEKVAFVLGDHIGLSEEDEREVLKKTSKIVRLSPISLQADQCIVIAHYELDRL